MSSEAATGAVQGAAVGTAIMPGIGTAVGAVVGFVSGLFASKSKKKKKKANELRARMAERDAAIQRRDLVRSIRIQRAQSVAAGTGDGEVISSAVAGAAGSIGSQGENSLNFFASQYQLNATANKYDAKAERYAGYAAAGQTLLSAAGSMASAGMTTAGMFRTGAKPYTPSVNGGTYTTTPRNSYGMGNGSSIGMA